MLTLIKNETIKLLKRPKTLVTFIAFLLLISLIAFSSYKEAENRKQWNTPDYKISNAEYNLEWMKEELKNPNTDEMYKTQLKESIKQEEENIIQYKKEKESGIADWRISVKASIEENNSLLQQPELDEGSKSYYESQIAYNQYLLDNDIDPTKGIEFNSFNAIQTIFLILGMVFLAVGLCIFAADMVSGEYTPATMKVLLIQPVSRGKVLFSKFISVIITCILLITSVEGIAFLLIGLFFGFGNAHFPISQGSKFAFDKITTSDMAKQVHEIMGSSTMTPIWKVTLNSLLLQILFIIAVVSFVFLISTVLKSSMLSTSLSTVLIVALFIIPNLSASIRKIMPYCFLTYGSPSDLLSGYINMNYNTTFITPTFAIIVMLIWSTVCYLVAHFVFVKKDILI
ncbi:ABC transporter permease subunit [Clostridium grantii]|uniref:ABC-2 type transport system permease protein n=1 Tax=Clostridium grantii DSM 8605 TaxID=1121316 RepID=A0A1M5QDT5_9CLOT|nr:ABC transporter permease subunit [Clostridium grantii]SHH12315.1 ABC-2 type transport system permease protein [Clostridium grantii DSM 8605]